MEVKLSNPSYAQVQEEILVIFHASALGRSDIIKNALSEIKNKCKEYTLKDTAEIVSTRRVEDDMTPLHIASVHGHADVIRSLLNAGADPSQKIGFGENEGRVAYELAGDASKQVFQVYFFEQVAMGKFDMIALLIQSGIPVSISDGSKADDTPLHWACSFNSPEVAELLISNGADVNTVNNEGQSALHLACKNNNYEIIRMLLSEGADMNVIDDKGHLPINLLPTTSANDATSQKTKILFEKPPDITFFYRNIYLEKLKAELLERDRDESDSERLNDSTVVKDFSADDTVHRNSNLNSSPSRHNESTHVHGTGGMNDHTGYVNDEGVNYDDDDDNDDDNSLQHKDGPQLVIWPPTQKQCFHGAIPLVISSDVELPFYIGKSISDGDYNKLLVASELIDLLGKLGFQSRISRNPMIGKIRLNIDSNLVPGRHAYQLSIESEYVNLIASDISGLFYGLFGFVQLLQLHSEITVQKNVTTIYIPPVHISDHPEIQNRAVLWSFRGSARMQYPVIKEHILLMSKLRINMLLLSIDPVDDDNGDLEYALSTVPAEGTSVSASSNLIGLRPSQVLSENSNGGTSQIPAEEDTQSARVSELSQLCQQVFVDLVPTLLFTTLSQSVPPLSAFATTSTVCLGFLYDPYAIEKRLLLQKEILLQKQKLENSTDLPTTTYEPDTPSSTHLSLETKVQSLCQHAVKHILLSLQESGITSIILCCNEWTDRITNPQLIATKLGLTVIKHSVEHLLQPSLYFKPILSLADYIHQLSQSVHPKSGKKSSSLAVLPGFTEMNYLFPSVLLKYFYFLHSGYTWNSNAVLDMLSVGARAILVNMTDSTTGAYTNDTYDSHWQSSGAIDGSDMIYCASIFREVICLILFNRRVAQMNITMQTVLNLLTGEWKFQSTKSVSVNKGTKLSVTSATASRIAGLKGNSLMSQDNDDTMSVAGHIHRSSSQELNTIDHSGVGGRMAGVFNYSTNKNGIQTSNLFHTEQYLWSLLMCPDHMFISSLVPSKDDISECLKYYRRLLTASQWKRITSTQKSFLENFTGFKLSSSQHQVEEFEPDVNELFSIISILGIVCRAIILSYNVYLKTNTNTTSNGLSNGTIQPNILTIKHLKLGELLEYLPPGSKSDIANQLLESLEFSGNIWKNKFDPIWFQTNQISYSSYSSTLSSVALTQLLSHSNNKRNSQNLNMTADNRNSSHAVGLMNTSTTFKPSQLARFFKQNYLFIDTPIIPLVTFFKIISEKLPMPYPPEQTLTRMFPNVATTASST